MSRNKYLEARALARKPRTAMCKEEKGELERSPGPACQVTMALEMGGPTSRSLMTVSVICDTKRVFRLIPALAIRYSH